MPNVTRSRILVRIPVPTWRNRTVAYRAPRIEEIPPTWPTIALTVLQCYTE